MPSLTTAREALWSAIDNWPDLLPGGRPAFKRTIRHGDDEGLLMSAQDVGIGDLPAIEIAPARLEPRWYLQRNMEFPLVLDVKLIGLRLSELEDLVEKVWKAFYQAAPAEHPTVCYLRAATGYYPTRLGPITTQVVQLGKERKTRAWLFTLQIGLKFLGDPLGTA